MSDPTAPRGDDLLKAREWAERHGFLIPFDPPTADQLAELVAAGRADERAKVAAAENAGLTWTGEPPTAGWWWWRRSQHKNELIVWVYQTEAGERRVRRSDVFAESEPLAEWVSFRGVPCQWAGPIPPPQG